jgi:murein DD-endopeptidase MepM/ murein hydrolase activator NlpD
MKRFLFLLFIASALFSCSRLKEIISPCSPREKYIDELSAADIKGKALAAVWDSLGKSSLNDSLFVSLPHAEAFYSNGKDISSHIVRFTVPKGRRARITIEGGSALRLFADLFTVKDLADEKPVTEIIAREDSLIEYTADATSDMLLRIQPEVNGKGFYKVSIETEASIGFPVSSRNVKAVGSFWGAERDGGKRKHEGVDIFAPKGTPLIAVADGMIIKTGTNKLGGKVVWLQNKNLKYNYYYAHLDSQMVKPGKIVHKGDTIGTVGNTGNARTTPPHLHFGIYERGTGATDPYSFLDDLRKRSAPVDIDKSMFSIAKVKKVKKARIDLLRDCNNPKGTSICSLTPDEDLRIVGVSGDYVRVVTREGKKGFVTRRSVRLVNDEKHS